MYVSLSMLLDRLLLRVWSKIYYSYRDDFAGGLLLNAQHLWCVNCTVGTFIVALKPKICYSMDYPFCRDLLIIHGSQENADIFFTYKLQHFHKNTLFYYKWGLKSNFMDAIK